MLFIAISAQYLIIAENTGINYKNLDLYHYNDNIELYISNNPYSVPNSIISIPYHNDKIYYLLQVNNDNISIPSSSIIYRDFENGIMLFVDNGDISIGKGNEITRLFFNTKIEKKPLISTVINKELYKTDYSFLDSISNYIDADSIYNTVAVISGEYSYPSGYYNITRFSDQPGCDTAANYLFDKFTTYGIDSVFFHYFTGTFPSFMGGGTFNSQNVVGFKRGTGSSNEVIVVGAHYDDVSEPYNDHGSVSPGADDNASGVAGVMEMARLFNSMDSEKDIYFVCFSGEEEGLYGSYYFVNDFISSHSLSVYAMINMDMIGYTTGAYGLRLYGQAFSSPLKNLYKDIADNITTLSSYILGSSSGSDHYYFEQAGYKSVFAIENEFSPVYHTYADSISYMTNDFMREVIRASTGTCYNVMNMPSSVSSISLMDNGDSSITVNWTQIPDTDIVGYRIYYNDLNISIPDTNAYTLNSLMPDTLYTVYVTAVDSEDLEGFVDESDTITPSFLPHKVTINSIRSDNDNVYLTYDAVKSTDFDHYNILRSIKDDTTFNKIAETIDTFFTDTTIINSEIYQYTVTVSDNSGYESERSNIVFCRLITLNEFILVIDETNNSTLMPDNKTDAFYDSIFELYTHHTLDADNVDEIDITIIGDYQKVIYIDDDLNENKMNMQHFADYINNGGNLILFGWDIGKPILDNPTVFPAQADSTSIARTDFGILSYNRNQSFDMTYLLYNDGTHIDSFYFEADKLPRGSNGRLSYGGIFELDSSRTYSLGKYISYSSDSAFDSKTNVFINADTNLIIANIPLYPMNINDGILLVEYLMEKFDCYSGLSNNVFSTNRSVRIDNIVSSSIDILFEGFKNTNVRIDIYDINGRYAGNLFNGNINSAKYSINKTVDLPSGIYFVRTVSDVFNEIGKLIIMK